MRRRSWYKASQLILIATTFLLSVTAIFFLADYVASSTVAQNLVSQFGYFGVAALATIAGLNVLVPVPAATFTPVFLAAGLWMPLIILTLVIGTLIADVIGFVFGRWSRSYVELHYPNSYRRISFLYTHHRHLILPAVFLYAAIIPFPNEAMLIPLAIMGFRFEQLLLPLFLGNAVNQTVLAYGSTNIFSFLFL